MKNLIRIFLFLLIICSFLPSLQAQDKIVLLKGDTITATITKINPETIWFFYPQNKDSVIQLSTSFVRKIIYFDGKEELVEHLSKIKNNTFISSKNVLYVSGNRYILNGNTISHANLQTIYAPLKDSLLNNIYLKGMNMKNTSNFLKFATIPLGALGFGLAIISDIPTNQSVFSSANSQSQYGNHNLLIPGIFLMGSALLTGIAGIITHKAYKPLLKKSFKRYNEIISKHELN